MKSRDELITFARETLGLTQSLSVELIPFTGRGSDRSYFRFKWGEKNSAILLNYEAGRIENAYFADIATFLYENHIPVPRVLRHDAGSCCILMEDLGDIDLWSLRNASWTARKDLYQKTLVAAHRLHSFPGPRFPYDRVKLMEACGPSFYRWERDYFKSNFIEALCEIRLEADWEQKLEAELAGLEKRLLSYRQSLIHRDLQSQNVMIWEEEPFFIDFQGMRFGTPFYDLGSFLCDPYVSISETQRMELLSYYYELLHPETDWNSFQTAFWEASAQRLMQALGAYGFLGIKKRLKDYLKHVPRGLRNLVKAAGEARGLPTLLETCARCESALAKSNSRFEIRD